MNEVIIDGEHLTVKDVCDIAERGSKVSLPSEKSFWDRLEKARLFLVNYIKRGIPTYGVTTDFGDSCAIQISYEKSGELQRDIVAYHGIGLGKKFSREVGRAVIASRLNSNVKGGYSAIRTELARMLETLLNRDIIPVIPELGSVGASGDLTPLSYLAAVVMGEREVYYKGKIKPTSEVFKETGITPLPLEAKEGLALMNGTSVMTALSCLAIEKAKRLANISDFITLATAEVLRGKDTPFLPITHKIKNHAGEIESAECIYRNIEQSKRVYQYETFLKTKIETLGNATYKEQQNKIQDRYSIRCAPQINGVFRDTISLAERWTTEELNSANDNPLVDLDAERLLNTGNFYGGHICAANDYLRIAVANISDLSDKQAEILIDGKFNGLTSNLIPPTPPTDPRSGLRLGFKAAEITISAIRGEIQTYSFPVSITSSPTEALNQDKVSMGTISARKLLEQEDLLFLQYSVHLLAIAQGIDLSALTSKIDDFSPFSRTVHAEVRKMSEFLCDDRPLDRDAERVREWLEKTELFA